MQEPLATGTQEPPVRILGAGEIPRRRRDKGTTLFQTGEHTRQAFLGAQSAVVRRNDLFFANPFRCLQQRNLVVTTVPRDPGSVRWSPTHQHLRRDARDADYLAEIADEILRSLELVNVAG